MFSGLCKAEVLGRMKALFTKLLRLRRVLELISPWSDKIIVDHKILIRKGNLQIIVIELGSIIISVKTTPE